MQIRWTAFAMTQQQALLTANGALGCGMTGRDEVHLRTLVQLLLRAVTNFMSRGLWLLDLSYLIQKMHKVGRPKGSPAHCCPGVKTATL
jgi:hypothetical protein